MIFTVEMRKYFQDPEIEPGTSIVYWLYTIFTQSDAVATIYFIARVCAAFNISSCHRGYSQRNG